MEQKKPSEQTPLTDKALEQVDGGRIQICNTASPSGSTTQTFRCAYCQKEYAQLPANGICESCANAINANSTAKVRFI